MDDAIEANRRLWDAWTRVNLTSSLYDVEAFVAGRGRDLDPIARAGPGDVRGKSLLHLQCHFGMDSIRWARHGAIVTGVDFSTEAIAAARELAARMNVPVTFVQYRMACGDVQAAILTKSFQPPSDETWPAPGKQLERLRRDFLVACQRVVGSRINDRRT